MKELAKVLYKIFKIWLTVCLTVLIFSVVGLCIWWRLDGKQRLEHANQQLEMIKKESEDTTSEADTSSYSDDTEDYDDSYDPSLDDENSAYMTYTAPTGESITIIASDYNRFKYYYENEYTQAGLTLEEIYAQWKGYR